MKAVRIYEYGGPEVLTYEDAPRPTIAAGQVLVKVHASSVNSVEWKFRAGYLRGFIDPPLPLTLGIDLSGIVEEASPQVTSVAVGDAVFGNSNAMRQGTNAEYAVMGATDVAPKPKTIDHVAAAAVPLAGLTAWQALAAAGLQPGQTVLIHGAGGGVGTFAVQFAHQKGARVFGTASAGKLDLLRQLGVDEPIDYNATRFEDVAQDVDFVLDTIGGEVLERSWGVLKPGGTLVTVAGQPDAAKAAARGVRGLTIMAQANVADYAEIARLIDAGAVKPVVSTVVPLAETRRAHELIERGHAQGKIVLRVVD